MGTNILNSTITISSSNSTIPLVGFGTAEFPFGSSSSETIKESVLQAIKLGYRHFDSASLYQSELPLGEAISEALRSGLVKSRDELFITSKLWCGDGHKDLVVSALQKSLRNLQLEYLDLYLIHFPMSLKPGISFPYSKEDVVPMDFKSVWEAMEECQKLGLTKSIGVSNFTCKKLETLLAAAKIPPAVNQVEISPLWQQMKLRDFCKEKGILVAAYSPLGARSTVWGTNKVLENEVLKEIATERGKTTAQVCLRWVYEQGVCLLVKSFNKERMKENLDIFGWKLNREDLEKISQLPQQRASLADHCVYEKGPFKSIEELWDGEI